MNPVNKMLGSRKARFMQWLKVKGLGPNDTIVEYDGIYGFGVVGFDENPNYASQQSTWETKVSDYIKNELR